MLGGDENRAKRRPHDQKHNCKCNANVVIGKCFLTGYDNNFLRR